MDNQRERSADRFSGIGWIVFGLIVIAASFRMPVETQLGASFITGPGFVPMLIGASLVLMGGVMILRSRAAGLAPFLGTFGRASVARVALALALMLVFALVLVGLVSFGVATFLFVTVFIVAFNLPVRSPRAGALLALKAAATGAITAVTVVLVFENVFLVRLP